MVTTKWLASLSDGTTVVEGMSPYEIIKGEDSPWLRLIAYLKEEGLHITGLRIQVKKDEEATRTYNLPSFNCNQNGTHEKWAKLNVLVPIGFDYHRRIRRSLTTKEIRKYIQITAMFELFDISILIDEIEGTESWAVAHK